MGIEGEGGGLISERKKIVSIALTFYCAKRKYERCTLLYVIKK